MQDFEPEDLEKIPFENPHIITMVYTSNARMRKVLMQSDFPNDVYIDNDYGLIVPIAEFIRLGMLVYE